MSVVAVLRRRRRVFAAMYASVVVGLLEKNGGLWCSPSAKTSSPTSSAWIAISMSSLMRCASDTAAPVCGSGEMSLTEKMPNCTGLSGVGVVSSIVSSYSCVCIDIRREPRMPHQYSCRAAVSSGRGHLDSDAEDERVDRALVNRAS